jgi:CelD/BcsL family acetyltransferase involved in cellulose biosynthesis
MKNNPFTCPTYVSKWFSHFEKNKTEKKFNFIEGISFYKHSRLPLYISSGKNLTKGISYELSEKDAADYKGNVYLIYDIPEFFNIKTNSNQKSLKVKRVKQYPGFLVELDSFNNIDDYMNTTFQKSSRYKLRKYKNRFEQCFDISYKMYYGEISKEEYDFVFDNFRQLLEKRFLDKQITNNNLNVNEWNFYYEVVYPLILEKKASLQVIYDGKKPIGVTLNYFSDTILFDAITVFDIDYSKFHLGSITIMKLIEWSIDNKFKIFDFTKGYFDYKKRWATRQYDFEYHILYDSSSLKAKLIAKSVESCF